jgi:hypothetical protein
MPAAIETFVDSYLTAPEEKPAGETVEQLETRLHDWITKLVNEHGKVLFTWRRLRQEVLPEYRRGKQNFAVHRTLNVFGANPKLNWVLICSQVRCDSVHREGIVLRKVWIPELSPLSWIANDILNNLCDDAKLVRLVTLHTRPMGHIANLAVASVVKSKPDTSKQQRQRDLRAHARKALPRYAIPVSNSWFNVG